VTAQTKKPIDFGSIAKTILLCSLVMILPAVEWTLFGWMHVAVPLVAFCIFSIYGEHTGKRFVLTAAALSAIILLLLGSYDLIFFCGVLLLTGYVLHLSAKKSESPSLSGFKACLAMSIGWAAVLWFFSLGPGISPYGRLLESLDLGIIEALEYYRASETVSAETLIMLERTLSQMQVIVPLIMPAMLGSLVVFVIWFTMVAGNTVLQRLQGNMPWPAYRFWQLPDRLIWLVIVTGVLALLPLDQLRTIAINTILLLAIIYCFQGLAIAVFFMDKWKVPVFLRAFFYVMLILQSFGTVILLLLGIADIWFDTRRLQKSETEEDE
jgi:uncharacterized protein YybS (DUF2232 family)